MNAPLFAFVSHCAGAKIEWPARKTCRGSYPKFVYSTRLRGISLIVIMINILYTYCHMISPIFGLCVLFTNLISTIIIILNTSTTYVDCYLKWNRIFMAFYHSITIGSLRNVPWFCTLVLFIYLVLKSEILCNSIINFVVVRFFTASLQINENI